MLGKNNNNEGVKKMAMQAKQDHFSIRKLSIGAASVLLGFTYLGLSSKTVSADTVIPPQQISKKSKVTAKIDAQATPTPRDDAAQNSTTATNNITKTTKPESEPNLGTFSGLSSFLRENSSNSEQSNAEAKTDSEDINAVKDDKQNSVTDNVQNDNKQSGQDKTADPTAVDTADRDQNEQKQDSLTAKITNRDLRDVGEKRSVGNWKGFISALADSNVSEIDITNNISADKDRRTHSYFQGRKLLIKSAGIAKYTLDFKGIDPALASNSSLDMTYENLILKSTDYYGVINTSNMNRDQKARVTFRNIVFYGSQLVFTRNNTDIIFEGQIHAETIKIPSNVGWLFDGSNQQLLEFTSSNNSITFKAGCHFDGSTFGGTLIEMRGESNSLNVEEGAVVNLTPLKTYDGTNGANNSEHGYPVSAIFISDDAQVTVHGQVNINIGQSEGINYAGKQNNGQARAIYLDNAKSKVNIGRGGIINVNTNGNISTRDKQNLI